MPTKLSLKERKRLLKKIGAPLWTGWYRDDIKWKDVPSGVRKALLEVKQAEIIIKMKRRSRRKKK